MMKSNRINTNKKKVIIAIDSFKDFASSKQVGNWIKAGMKEVIPEEYIQVIPIADGGEGTIEVLVEAFDGYKRSVNVRDALYRKTKADVGIIKKNGEEIAVIEIAQASGMQKLKLHERNTMKASSYGTGMLIKHALDLNISKIIIGLGGSIVSDGGMGAAYALGARFLDRNGEEISLTRDKGYTVEALPSIHKINTENLDTRIKDTGFIVASDVNNPLLGPKGQAHTFGPQKGANKEEIKFIESALSNFAKVLYKSFSKNFDIELAGAAGGLGAGLSAFLHGKLILGINFIMDCIDFEKKIRGASILITGEGRLDETTLNNKACLEIAKKGKKCGIRTIAICGSVKTDPKLFHNYFDRIVDVSDGSESNLDSEEFKCCVGPRRIKKAGRRIE